MGRPLGHADTDVAHHSGECRSYSGLGCPNQAWSPLVCWHRRRSSHRYERSWCLDYTICESTRKISSLSFCALKRSWAYFRLSTCLMTAKIPSTLRGSLFRGASVLSTFIRKLLSSYATGDNRRHKHHGHIFQNRYKSIVCEEEPYSLRLVSYFHLNPLRAGLAESLEDLERYPWSGHPVVMNRIRHEWQDRNYVLGYFGKHESSARKAYQKFFAKERPRRKQSESPMPERRDCSGFQPLR
jgi:hypothetical protein